MKKDYEKYIHEINLEGSNKASSYIRALELLATILKKTSSINSQPVDFWSIELPEEIEKLYEKALRLQKKEGSVFLNSDFPPSYGRNGYYSAALKSYKEFLIIHKYEEKMWKHYREFSDSPKEIANQLSSENIESIEYLVERKDISFESREGKEVLRSVKTRVNQNFFRKMILFTYKTQCCLTGLNVPEVLRASHIVGWAEDENCRLNPTNGLCLSATYDAAFDRHLISFDKDYRMILSLSLKDYYTNQAFQDYFKSKEGCKILLPERFKPDQFFLENHRCKLQ